MKESIVVLCFSEIESNRGRGIPVIHLMENLLIGKKNRTKPRKTESVHHEKPAIASLFMARFLFATLFLGLFILAAGIRPAALLAADGEDTPNFSDPGSGSDNSPEFTNTPDIGVGTTVNPLAQPNQILFDAALGFVPSVGPTVSGATGNAQTGVGFLVDLEAGYTILPNLVATLGISIHAFSNDTNIPVLLGVQYYFDNGGGFPMIMGNQKLTLVPYIEAAMGPVFNVSTDSAGTGVGAMAFGFRVGPGVLIPFGVNRHQGIYFEIDYETQGGPFSGGGLSSSAFTLIPVKVGYTTIF